MKHRFPISLLCGAVLLSAACDSTIHEYPGSGTSTVLLQLDVDRTPPLYYKEIVYDQEGAASERLLDATPAEPYTPDERLCMRLVTELYEVPSATTRTGLGRLVARHVTAAGRLSEPPQQVLEFRLPAGTYKALAWADYAPQDAPSSDWHFTADTLNAVRVHVGHMPQDNHHKSSAAGTQAFSVDLGRSAEGCVTLLGGAGEISPADRTVPVGMERASGRFRLWANDLQKFLDGGNRLSDLNVRIVYKQYVSAGYNVDTGTPNRFVRTRTMKAAPSVQPGDGTVLLAYDYVLTSSDKEDHVLVDIFVDKGDRTINHYQDIEIPLRRNRETVVRGPFLTRKIGSGDIGIEEGFDDEFVVVVPD